MKHPIVKATLSNWRWYVYQRSINVARCAESAKEARKELGEDAYIVYMGGVYYAMTKEDYETVKECT